MVFRRYFVAALAVVSVLLLATALYHLRYVALIVTIAGLLAYLLAWPTERLSKRWPRAAAVAFVFITFLLILMGLLGAFVPILTQEIQELAAGSTVLIENLERSVQSWEVQILPDWKFRFSDYLVNIGDDLQERFPALLANAFDFTQSLVSGTATVVAAILIVPLITLYFLLDSQRLKRSLVSFFAPHLQEDADQAVTAVNKSLGSYIYSRVLLALFVGTATTAILLIFGVPYAVLLGMLAFFGEFIPVVGPVIAYIPIGLIVLAMGEPVNWIWITILYICVQLIENYLIVPKLMGDTMDLHPLTVIVAMLIGGTLGGIAGLLVAIPAAAALKVIFGVFVFRQQQPGIEVPQIDLIRGSGNPDIQESGKSPPAG